MEGDHLAFTIQKLFFNLSWIISGCCNSIMLFMLEKKLDATGLIGYIFEAIDALCYE